VQNNTKAHVLILGANIFYGINYVIAKVALTSIPPYALVLTRVSIPLIFFGLIAFLYEKESIRRKDHFTFFYCGLFGVAANQLMFIKGLSLTSEIHASLIMITTPILVLVMSWFFLKDPITWRKVLGVAIGGAGVYMLVQSGIHNEASSSSLSGDLLIMGNAASYGLFLVLAKPLMHAYKPFTVTFWLFFYGLLMVLPFGLTEMGSIPPEAYSGKVLWSWLYIIFISTLAVYIMNVLGLKFGSPALVSIYIYLQPLLAAFISVLLGKDSLTLPLILSACLIFSGVALVSMRKRQMQPKRKEHLT
jgi:drug/metabolite transporter (DMT)-like permease